MRLEATGNGIRIFGFLLLFFLAFLTPPASRLSPVLSQEFYRWTDDSGAVHFTDNLYSIPEKYRGQVEKRFQTPSREPAVPAPDLPTRPSQSRQFIVPFTRSEGNHILVEGTVNGRGAVKFILDTGAAGSTIPLSLAIQTGIDPDGGLLVTMGGVGGSVNVPLVEVNNINVGGAEVRNLEVTIQDLPFGNMGALGLLGADFLLEYRVEIEYAKNQVILEAQEGPYGGHSFEWWQRRFRRYADHKRGLEAGRSRAGSETARDLLDKQLRIVEGKINDLESRASQAGIPREFRQ